jgi:hypothetical protein
MSAKAPQRIERQIDGVELDVRHRVQQRTPSCAVEGRAPRQSARLDQARPGGPARGTGKGIEPQGGIDSSPTRPGRREPVDLRDLARRTRFEQCRAGLRPELHP